MNYINSLSHSQFVRLAQAFIDANERNGLAKRRSYIQVKMYLQLDAGVLLKHSFFERVGLFYDTEELVSLRVDGLFIDIYNRMKKELQE